MRMLNRTAVLSLVFLPSSVLAPGAANAQAPQDQPQQPGAPPPQPSTPGYPQQQAYPQPGYPQQQPGYPQQQAYPQPGYPQQQAYPQPGYPQQQAPGYPQFPGYPQESAPPRGYYPPPAAFPPPPASEPQPSSDRPPARPAYRRGLLLLPHVGGLVVVRSSSDNSSIGLQAGGLLGGHIGPLFSLNGELGLHLMSPNSTREYDSTEFLLDIALSPLFHFGVPRHVEFVVGPRLGMFVFAGSRTESGYSGSMRYSGEGVAYGLNAGILFPFGSAKSAAIGGLLSFSRHSFSDTSCSDSIHPSGAYDYSNQCTITPTDFNMFTLSVACLL